MAASESETLKERVETWLTGQMPIISMHGGTSAVREADPAAGRVVVELGGTCSGCGVSGRTAHNIKMDLAAEFPDIDDVIVRTGDDGSGDWDLQQAESYMGIERTEGGRGGHVDQPEHDHDSHL